MSVSAWLADAHDSGPAVLEAGGLFLGLLLRFIALSIHEEPGPGGNAGFGGFYQGGVLVKQDGGRVLAVVSDDNILAN